MRLILNSKEKEEAKKLLGLSTEGIVSILDLLEAIDKVHDSWELSGSYGQTYRFWINTKDAVAVGTEPIEVIFDALRCERVTPPDSSRGFEGLTDASVFTLWSKWCFARSQKGIRSFGGPYRNNKALLRDLDKYMGDMSEEIKALKKRIEYLTPFAVIGALLSILLIAFSLLR